MYKIKGTSAWTSVTTSGKQRSVIIKNLQPSTNYVWKVRTKCGTDTSSFSPQASFTTTSFPDAKTGNNIIALTHTAASMEVTPNPVTGGFFRLQLSLPDSVTKSVVQLTLYNAAGNKVWSQAATATDPRLDMKIALPASLAQGTYFLQATTGNSHLSKTIVIEKQQ